MGVIFYHTFLGVFRTVGRLENFKVTHTNKEMDFFGLSLVTVFEGFFPT